MQGSTIVVVAVGLARKKHITKFNRFNSNFMYTLIVIYLQHKTNLNIFLFSVFVSLQVCMKIFIQKNLNHFTHIDLMKPDAERAEQTNTTTIAINSCVFKFKPWKV